MPFSLSCAMKAMGGLVIIAASAASGFPGSLPSTQTPALQSPTEFQVSGSTIRDQSSWGVASSSAPQPQNERSLTFWGRWVPNSPCSSNTTWGFSSPHSSFVTSLGNVLDAFSPACGGGTSGPGVEADLIMAAGLWKSHQVHLVQTVAASMGPFGTFGVLGQPPSGANLNISASYIDFNPKWQASYPNRTKPFLCPRVAIVANQSVSLLSLPAPTQQQTQQVIKVVFINESCDISKSRSFCQISFNLKTHIAGLNAYGPGHPAQTFQDPGQKGLIVVLGPINEKDKPTSFLNRTAYTSYGVSTQAGEFGPSTFRIEMTWEQFQFVLVGVSKGNAASVFGPQWNIASAWVLLRMGYGQENFNKGGGDSAIEGLFQEMQVTSVC